MFVPHRTVINKTIVYSDTVLPLKDKSNNLKVTTISNVEEYSLESCLKTIFESNPNVAFNTIQYSKKDKTVYFYTNQDVTTKTYEESKFKPIISRTEILEEVRSILTSDRIKNNDCISLFDVADLIYQTTQKYNDLVSCYDEYLEDIIELAFDGASVVIYDFDYKNNELSIGFDYSDENFKEITFVKKDSNLYVSKSESIWEKEVLVAIGDELSRLYDEFMEFSAYKQEQSYRINPINSNFFVDVDSFGIHIYTLSSTNSYMKDFKLTFSSDEGEYDYDCDSNNVINACKGIENEIFKRIFIKIDDCPSWTRSILYETRQKHLEIVDEHLKRLEFERKFKK